MRAGLPSPEAMGIQIEFFLRLLHRKLTRFDPGSELCALNAEPGETCSVSPTLAVAVDAALWAAERSDGLVDPTLVGELEEAGYATSEPTLSAGADRAGARRRAASASPARPRADAAGGGSPSTAVAGWSAGRPASGSTPAAPARGWPPTSPPSGLGGYATHVVDAGGDLRIGGERPLEREVRIEHPLDASELAHEFLLDRGAVATSGIKTRLWRTETASPTTCSIPRPASPPGRA